MGKSVPQGAVTTINCAVNPTLNSQQAIYYSDGTPKQPSSTARYRYNYSMNYWWHICYRFAKHFQVLKLPKYNHAILSRSLGPLFNI